MIYAYIRVSREHQCGSSQEFEIRKFLKANGLKADCWIREQVSGTVDASKRKLGETISIMREEDLLVCTEISRLGRNMLMIMSILNDCLQRGIRIRTIKDNFILGNNINSKIIAFSFALAAEIERNLIAQRTREALADKKAAGIILGRPSGSCKCREKVRADKARILEMRAAGQSVGSIAKRYGISISTLRRYLL